LKQKNLTLEGTIRELEQIIRVKKDVELQLG